MTGRKQVELEVLLAQKHNAYWFEHVLWSPLWWFGIGCVSFAVWLLYRHVDRARIVPIIVAGICSVEITTILDAMGIFVPLWMYPYPTGPSYEPLFAVDFFLIPMPCMLLYQYQPRWKPFLVGTVLLSLLFAFGFEPLAEWLELYVLLGWKYVYSVPLYIFVFVITKLCADGVEKLHRRALTEEAR